MNYLINIIGDQETFQEVSKISLLDKSLQIINILTT